VHLILQHLGHGAQQQPPSGSAGGWMRGGSNPSVGPTGTSKGAAPSDTWAPGGSQLWNPNSSASSLWGTAPLDTTGDQHRATPSSLNSFLPGDLLGGESM
jgi:trinucleotide repeat-containing gene 6 protein